MSGDAQRAELHRTIWRIANDLRGSVDGWDFKAYVLGMLFYRFISENLTAYLNAHERRLDPTFDYAALADEDAEIARAETVQEKGFFIYPSELFVNVRKRAQPRQVQDYQSVYLDLYEAFRGRDAAEKEQIVDDLVFEIELIKQVEINVDYILMLVRKHEEAKGDGQDREVCAQIERAVDSSPTRRNKKDLIEAFVDSLSVDADVDGAWRSFIEGKRGEELDRIIADESLDPDATRAYMDAAFRDGVMQQTGTAITRVLPPVSRFSPLGEHGAKKQTVIKKLSDHFERFFGLS